MGNTFRIKIGLVLLLLVPVAGQGRAQGNFKEVLEALDAVVEVTTLESDVFSEKYLLLVEQQLDPEHLSAGTFHQRVIVGHAGYDKPTVLVTEGYGAAYALRQNYREEISRLLDANMVFVEHRYFLDSTPTGPLNWDLLTAKNSANDLHRVRELLREIYPEKWIATGISKGGQTTMIYQTFFPGDVDISVPYVAPLCRAVEDGRHEPFLRQVATPAARKEIEGFQKEILKRRTSLFPLFSDWCERKAYRFRIPLEEVYDYCVLEYSFAFWQWGTSIDDIPPLDSTDQILFDHLMDISEPSYFAQESSFLSFFVQAAKELGYYGYDTQPFEDHLVIESSKGYLHRVMLPEELEGLTFDPSLYHRITTYLEENDPRLIFIYGEYDPWTAPGVTWLENKENVKVFIEPEGSHKARISTLPEKMKEMVIEQIKQWLEL